MSRSRPAAPGEPPPASNFSRRHPLGAAALLALAVLVVYHNALSTPFVFDDQFAIVDNPTIRHLSHLGDVLRPPPYASGAAGRPLVNLSLALNYALDGLNPWGYHATNVLLHLLASFALFGVIRRTLENRAVGKSFFIALAAAGVWAVHPLLTESVTCVVQRNEVMAGLFFLLTLYCFIRATAPAGPRFWRGLAVVSCLLGLASKEILVAAPVIVLLYDHTFVAGNFRDAWRARRGFHLALGSTWLFLVALMATTQHRGGTVGFGLGVSAWDYLLTQCRALTLYLKLAVWPHPLVIDYGTDIVTRPANVALPGIGLLLVLAATIVALWRRPALGFLGACFFAILAPSSSFVPLVSQPIAEHRMYLPLAAIVVLAVVGLFKVIGPKSLLAWPAIALGLGVVTVQRNADYRDEVSLLQSALAANPRNDRVYLNLGTLAARAGHAAEAIGYYEKALAFNPSAGDTHYNYAVALDQAGRTSDAIEQYREAIRLKPDLPAAHYYLGVVLAKIGRADDAVAEFERALALQPDSATARRSLAAAHAALGNASAQAGRLQDAVAHYDAALRAEPANAQVQNNAANALSQLGRSAEAISHYEAALRAAPDYAEAHFNLAAELLDAGRIDEAAEHYAAVLRLRPDDEQTRQILARINAQRKK